MWRMENLTVRSISIEVPDAFLVVFLKFLKLILRPSNLLTVLAPHNVGELHPFISYMVHFSGSLLLGNLQDFNHKLSNAGFKQVSIHDSLVQVDRYIVSGFSL